MAASATMASAANRILAFTCPPRSVTTANGAGLFVRSQNLDIAERLRHVAEVLVDGPRCVVRAEHGERQAAVALFSRPGLGRSDQGAPYALARRLFGYGEHAQVAMGLAREIVLEALEVREAHAIAATRFRDEERRAGGRAGEEGLDRARLAAHDLLARTPGRRREAGQPPRHLQHEGAVGGRRRANQCRRPIHGIMAAAPPCASPRPRGAVRWR